MNILEAYKKYENQIASVREIHKPTFLENQEVEVCKYCFELYGCYCCSWITEQEEFYWPCRTIRALGGDSYVR